MPNILDNKKNLHAKLANKSADKSLGILRFCCTDLHVQLLSWLPNRNVSTFKVTKLYGRRSTSDKLYRAIIIVDVYIVSNLAALKEFQINDMCVIV